MPSDTRPPKAAHKTAGPFGGLRATVAVAGMYGVAAVVWAVVGEVLPGGRWLAVHLFTAGVLTNLVVGLTAHFTETLTRGSLSAGGRRGRLVTVNVGALALLGGLPAGLGWVSAAGGLVLLAAVMWLYIDLRRARRQSLGSRFLFVVRAYERACGAFVHGSLLGAAMAAGVLGGAWYAAARIAHLQVMVLGWGGIVLLATVVFFGPTVLRARIEAGADETAGRALGITSWALTVAGLALLLTGLGGAGATIAQGVAGAGLAVYAVASTSVCLPVLRTARRAEGTVPGRMLAAACGWFVVAGWANVLVVATGRFDLLARLGVVALAGVLGQAILGALTYLTPMVMRLQSDTRRRVRARLELGWPARVWLFNAGVVAVAGAGPAPIGATASTAVAGVGWAMILATLAMLPAMTLWALVRAPRAA